MSRNNQLPAGWEWKKLGEVVDIINGRNQSEVISDEGKYPIYGSAANLMGYAKEYLCEAGTTIIGRKGNISTPIYVEERFWNVDTAFGLYPKNGYSPKFLHYLCQTIDFGSRNRGTTIPSLVKSDLLNIDVPFISNIPEQQRIVAFLDEAFAAIAQAKAHAEQNLQNAKALFESFLQGVFARGQWDLVKLSDMATDISDGDHMPPPKSEVGVPFITISNIDKLTHKIDFSDTFKVPQKYFDELKSNKRPIKGDVLYTVTGSFGIPVLIEDDSQFCFQRHIGLIRPGKELDSKLLFYWILSPQAIAQANETATGTAQKTVSLKSLRNFSFPNIPLETQQTIVRQLDALRAETQRLEAVYRQKLEDLEELKKSLLIRIFRIGGCTGLGFEDVED